MHKNEEFYNTLIDEINDNYQKGEYDTALTLYDKLIESCKQDYPEAVEYYSNERKSLVEDIPKLNEAKSILLNEYDAHLANNDFASALEDLDRVEEIYKSCKTLLPFGVKLGLNMIRRQIKSRMEVA